MIINNIEKAEELVKNNETLSWNGWDIEYMEQDNNGFMKTNGIFKNDKWHVKEVYQCVNGVWDIPNKLIKG